MKWQARWIFGSTISWISLCGNDAYAIIDGYVVSALRCCAADYAAFTLYSLPTDIAKPGLARGKTFS